MPKVGGRSWYVRAIMLPARSSYMVARLESSRGEFLVGSTRSDSRVSPTHAPGLAPGYGA